MSRDISNTGKEVQFKNLIWFFLASNSLILSGYFVSPRLSYFQLILLIWINFTGVFLVYRLNDCIDQHRDLKFNIKSFFSYRLHQIIVALFVFGVIPLSIIFLNSFVLSLLIIGAVLGIIYSINFKIGKKEFRLKNVFLIKNLLIGIVWGSLVLLGAGTNISVAANLIFIFACVQVFIGGIIRDIPDIEKDRNSGVKSFPVKIGIPATIKLLHIVNVASFFVVFLKLSSLMVLGPVFGVTVLWRIRNLNLLAEEPNNRKWSQVMNLVTCVLILFMLLTLRMLTILLP
jgi:4-hydroxybenzoate polyprenyltransferase